jgi:hypothetical protein
MGLQGITKVKVWTQLPKEITGQLYASKMKGKVHAYGYDGHTVMLLGVAKYLAEKVLLPCRRARRHDGAVDAARRAGNESRFS